MGTPRPHARRLLFALLASALVAALIAGPAQALMVKLPSGGYANLAPITAAGAPTGPRQFDSFFSNLDYNGGPVMPSNTNYVIAWTPSGYSGTAFQSGYVNGVARYFNDLAAASGTFTNTDSVAAQYRDSSGAPAGYVSGFGGTYTDTDPLPPNGCPAASGHICLNDAQLQSEVDSFVSSHGLPADLTHEYFLLTPPSVSSCVDSGGSECSANASQNQAYCAYHSYSTGSHVYANIPDLSGVPGCDPFVTNCPASSCAYDNGPADGMLSAIAHEHTESLTDPEPSSAWSDMQPGCTQSSPVTCGGEIGDKCVGSEFANPNLQLQNSGSQDTPYNETLNGDHYLLQLEWSNHGHGCLDSYVAGSTTANAAFTDSLGSGTTVNFDASGSSATGGVAHYVWQFNDPGLQGNTIETTSPTISHTFAGAGYYQVALTVMAADGTSSASSATIDVGAAASPSPGFSFSVAGGAASFDASVSSDPNAGGFITSYSWNFGDGSTGSGPSPSHTYSQPRAYTVTLAVTDASGLTNTYSRTVNLQGAPPVPAFSFSPARAGSATTFNGSASSAASGIAVYRWTFGDGANATGATASHAYRSAGTYMAVLTVTAQDGQSASVSHTVNVAGPPAPLAAFTSSGSHDSAPVSFNATASTAPSGQSIQSYIWSFGDGATASGAIVSHRFRAGRHRVTLTVIDTFGQVGSVSRTLTISDDTPDASFRAAAARRRAITVAARASDPDGRVVSYRWRFGDGATGRGASARHTYRRAGTYTVTLVVTDSSGRTTAVTHSIRVGASGARAHRH